MRSRPMLTGFVLGVAAVYVYHRVVGVPTGKVGKVPGGTIGP
jgi:hypothetical protein